MFVPRILLCGDEKNFSSLKVQIVGKISFKGAAERNEVFLFRTLEDLDKLPFDERSFQIFLDGEEISVGALKKFLDGTADYIVFDDGDELICRFNELYRLGLRDRFLTRETLVTYAAENFYSPQNVMKLGELLRDLEISRLLDADTFLAKNDLAYVNFPTVELEAVDEKFFAKKFPVVENLYGKIYSSLAACRLKNFDAVLLTKERSPEEFVDALIETDALAENIFVFVRKNSALEKFLSANENSFEKISAFPAVNGNWLLIKKFARDDFKIFVVTH